MGIQTVNPNKKRICLTFGDSGSAMSGRGLKELLLRLVKVFKATC
jgi:hypothetical protein